MSGLVGIFLLALLVATSAAPLPDASSSIDEVKDWAKNRAETAAKDFKGDRTPSPYWGNQIVYSIQVDRFNNGDKSNDALNLPQIQIRGDLSSLPDWRHGGDLAGIRQRLDYLKDLGVTTLWITPVIKHDGSYHGYCPTDLTLIDPGFGSNEEFRAFVKEAHDRGIYVVMDIVINHLCDPETTYTKSPDHRACAGDLNARSWRGDSSDSGFQGELKFSDDFFKPLKSPFFFNRCGPNSYEEMSGEGPEAVFGDFTQGMLDLNTGNYDFQEIFTWLMNYWIAYADIDGFRLDAAKHVTEDFLAYFSTVSRDFALSLGKDDFLVVGEVAGSADWIGRRVGRMFTNPYNPFDHGIVPGSLTNRIAQIKDIYLRHPKRGYPGMSSAYDFILSGTSREVASEKRFTSDIENYFKSDNHNIMAGQTDWLYYWTLMEIHDWPRLIQDDPMNYGRIAAGLGLILTLPGTPIIYYGAEQGFNGNCDFNKINAGSGNAAIQSNCMSWSDSRKRQDMFITGPYRLGSSIGEIYDLAYIGLSNETEPEQDPFLRTDHVLFKFIKGFAHIRQSCAALRTGGLNFRWTDMPNSGFNGLVAFSRVGDDTEVIVIINFNYNARVLPKRFQLDDRLNPVGGSDFRRYSNLMNLSQYATVGHDNGQAYLYFQYDADHTICGRCVWILVPDYKISKDPIPGTTFHSCSASSESIV